MTNQQIIKWAQGVLAQYGQKIADMLGMQLPTNITFKVGDISGANTSGTVITISKDVDGTDPGMIAHELTHAIMQVPSGDSKAAEAIADAVRYDLGLVYPSWKLSSAAKKFTQLNPTQFQAAVTGTVQGTITTAKDLTTLNTAAATTTTPGSPGFAAETPWPAGATGPATTTTTTTTGIFVNPQTGAVEDAGTPGAIPLAEWITNQSGTSSTNYKAAYTQLLQSWGIPMDDNLQALIDKGTQASWSITAFTNHLEQTKEFQQTFPGIFDANGTLKMSPTQYLSTVRSYQSYAAQTGINLSPQQTAYLFRNDVSPAEFAQRAQAVTSLRTNQQYFVAFNQQLKAQGMQPLTKGQQFSFVMGEGNQEWYDLWQKASTRYSAEESGLKFGKAAQAYTNLTQGAVNKIAGLGLTQPAMQQNFAALAKQLQTTLPMSRIQKFGLSKQDLVELEFGGPRQAAVAQKVRQIMANEDLFLKGRVNQGALSSGLTTGAARSQQQYRQGP